MRRKVVPPPPQKKIKGDYAAKKWCHFNCGNAKQPTFTVKKGIIIPFLHKKITGLLDCNLKRAVYSENIITDVRGTSHNYIMYCLFREDLMQNFRNVKV